MAICSSCGAHILWCKTVNGKSMPVDAVPADDGNMVITNGVALTPTEADGLKPRFRSHFSSCEFAAKHRGKDQNCE